MLIIKKLVYLYFLLNAFFSRPVFAEGTAVYIINEVKNEVGEVLPAVKIYVDGVYLHHYAPESLTFCEGCSCDNYVSCGFGEHTISLEKNNYLSWSETLNINIGQSFEVDPILLIPSPTPTFLLPTVTPTLTATAIPTAAPTAVGVYKINKAKDENNEILASVKIYVDDQYVHHYDDESLTFCSGCFCYEGVACGFGEHKISLEKNDYGSWQEVRTITAGDNLEVNPVLRKILPTSPPTPTASPSPQATPTAKPIQTPTPVITESKTPTPDPTSEPTKEPIGNILGDSAPAFNETKNNSDFPVLAVLPIILGLGLMGIAGFAFYKKNFLS